MEKVYGQQSQRNMRRAEEKLARNREKANRREREGRINQRRRRGLRFRDNWPTWLLLGVIFCSVLICYWLCLFPNPVDLCASYHECASKASNKRSEASRGSNRRKLLSWDAVTEQPEPSNEFNGSEGSGTKDYEIVPLLPPPMCPRSDFIQELISMVPASVCSELSGCSEDGIEVTAPALRSCYRKKCFCIRVCVEMDSCSGYGTEAIAPTTGSRYQALAFTSVGKPEIVAERRDGLDESSGT